MKNKYELHYHVNEDGSADVLCELLDCFEQPCYFEYRKISDRNPWIFFCGNTNLYFNEENQYFGVKNCEVRSQYIDIQTFPITGEGFKEITNLLNIYGEIIFTTAFNYVDDYVWYKDEGKKEMHTHHCSYLLGENDDFYFIAESPYVLLDAEKLQLKNNNSIFSIPKRHFAEAFNKFCIVKILNYKDIPDTKDAELEYFKAICKEICIDYETKNSIEKVAVGRKALLLLEGELKRGNENVMKDFFVFHMILSRRVVFKRCVNFFHTYMNDSSRVSELLKAAIEHWKKMKDLAFEYHYNNTKVCASAIKEMEEIIEIEDALVNSISNIRWIK